MYIKLMNDENINIYIKFWLVLITSLVGLMIIVGGLTRLTDSGLSITRWELISGILPPFTYDQWNNAFSLYKEIPEYKLLNFSMTLNEFKTIYWWEYAHRLLGRLIGILYLLPLIFFTIKKSFSKKLLFSFYFIFFLILLQGFMGWYMVKSGLTERTDVSHYRLSAHLTLAFIIFIMLFWNLFKLQKKENLDEYKKLPFYLPVFFLIIILAQISFGAFVSGLDAGKIYTTWPLMNNSYFPDDSLYIDIFSTEIFSNPSIVQFIHRNMAYAIFFVFIIILFTVFKNSNFNYMRKNCLIIFLILILQIFLGILTVVSGAQIFLASLHQIGSIFLIIASLRLVFINTKETN